MTVEEIIQLDVTVVTFVLGSLVPLVVALATKLNASSSVKAVVNVVVSVTVGVCGFLLAHDGATTPLALVGAVITAYLGSGVSYQHFWKPTGVAPAIQASTANVGIGSSTAAV